MSSKQAKEALERFKQEAANEVGVNLKNGYNGDLTSRQAGSIGGQMVKKMIESYENTMKSALIKAQKIPPTAGFFAWQNIFPVDLCAFGAYNQIKV